MSLPQITFVAMVCGAFSALAVTLGWATWYCRDRKTAFSPGRAPQEC